MSPTSRSGCRATPTTRPSAPAAEPPRFASNWEPSSARALTVVHYLQQEAKVDPRRLAAVAFGEYRPAARQKAKNRRIEIVLYRSTSSPGNRPRRDGRARPPAWSTGPADVPAATASDPVGVQSVEDQAPARIAAAATSPASIAPSMKPGQVVAASVPASTT
ncbi:MAG: OmpA family protein [Kofleriaceae bacterium]|nr:OmpA family protein [Kofleriaceae bacterium]